MNQLERRGFLGFVHFTGSFSVGWDVCVVCVLCHEDGVSRLMVLTRVFSYILFQCSTKTCPASEGP